MMTTNHTFQDLKNLLSIKGTESEDVIERRFYEIAEVLLYKTAIKKGEHLYFLTDIEFYWFSKNHKDTITYPRNCKAGEWYFHNSGVDITFESHVSTIVRDEKRKPILDGTESFGGILIRGIKPESNWFTDGENKSFDGPYKVVDELFDRFNAIDKPSDFPILIPCEHQAQFKTKARNNLLVKKTAEEKVYGILKNNYYDASDYLPELTDSFNRYFSRPYRYYL